MARIVRSSALSTVAIVIFLWGCNTMDRMVVCNFSDKSVNSPSCPMGKIIFQWDNTLIGQDGEFANSF